MASSSYDYDVIIIGSGAAGSVAAQQLAKAGKSVAIIESDTIGGSVPNYGSLPMQALMHAAQVYETARTSSSLGLRGSTVGYNYPSVKAWKDAVVRRSGMNNNADFFKQRGIDVIRGRGYFLDPNTISIGSSRLTAKKFIIATGAEITLPRIQGLETNTYLTPRTALNLTRPPRRLAIIGSGATACELANLFSVFGSEVYLVDKAKRILPDEEPEVSKIMEARFSEHYKMKLMMSSQIVGLRASGPLKQLIVKDVPPIIVDEVIIATERQAVTDIGLENAQVKYSQELIEVNNSLQTSNKNIFAIGDCATDQRYAHVATAHGHVAAYNILHHRKRQQAKADYRSVVRTLWTNPQVAAVGSTKRQLAARGEDHRSIVVPLDIVSRSNTANFDQGFLKLICDDRTLEILSATLVSPDANEAIHALSLAVHARLTIWQLASSSYGFGTWSELIRVAAAKLMH